MMELSFGVGNVLHGGINLFPVNLFYYERIIDVCYVITIYMIKK